MHPPAAPRDAPAASISPRSVPVGRGAGRCGIPFRVERVEREQLLGVPPAVDRGLADAGPLGDGVHAGCAKAALPEQLERGLQDRLLPRLAARSPAARRGATAPPCAALNLPLPARGVCRVRVSKLMKCLLSLCRIPSSYQKRDDQFRICATVIAIRFSKKEEQRCRPHSYQRRSSARPGSRSPASASAPGRSAAAATTGAGDRRTTTSRSRRSTTRSSSASTGSTRPRSTASGTRSRSSAARSRVSRERPYVFTKGGQPEGPGRTTVQSLRRDSLRRELRGQPRAARGRRDRPLPDPLADPRRGHRGGLVDARRAEGARASSATSASPTSTSRSCGGSSRSRRSRRCSRRTRWSRARSRRRSCRSPSARGSA